MKKRRKHGEAPPAGGGEQPQGGGGKGKGMKKRKRVAAQEGAASSAAAAAAAPPSTAAAGSNWQALKRKIGADGSGPKKAEKRVNKGAAPAGEVAEPASNGARRPEAKGAGHELTSVVSIDCEMVGVGPGGKASSLARATVVNNLGNVLLDAHVQQREKVTDYRTHVSGIRPNDLRADRGALPLEEAQRKVHELVKGRLLVGHAIHNDLHALQLSHPHKLIRDTAKYPPLMRVVHNGARKPKPRALRKLAAEQLGFEIQAGEHSPVDDARCALYLYHKHRREWEQWLRSNRASNMKKSRDNNPTARQPRPATPTP